MILRKTLAIEKRFDKLIGVKKVLFLNIYVQILKSNGTWKIANNQIENVVSIFQGQVYMLFFLSKLKLIICLPRGERGAVREATKDKESIRNSRYSILVVKYFSLHFGESHFDIIQNLFLQSRSKPNYPKDVE